MVGCLLFVFSVLGSIPAATAPTRNASQDAVSPEPIDAGTELARLIYPASVNSTIVRYTFDNIVGPTYRADPNLKALEAAHPGIVAALIAAIRPKFERGRNNALPALWAKGGDLYARRLNRTEMRQAIAADSSPIGRQLRDLKAQDVASAGEITPEIVLRAGPALQVGAAKAAFEATLAGRKLIALRPENYAINATWNMAPMPEANARIEVALAEVMTRFGVESRQTKQ